jgi:ubiquinone/menaquinone biosynthesis C-methylase UbiE
MPETNAPSEKRIDRGQLYLIVLLVTAAVSLVAGIVIMGWVARSFSPEALRRHVLNLLRNWPMVLPILAIALIVLIGRFVRWHFLLRSLNARPPLGTSLLAFYAGVPMMLTPAYIGELISAFVLNRLSGDSVFRGIAAIITGRVHDVLAIVILLGMHKGVGHGIILAAAMIALAGLGWLVSPVWTSGTGVLLRGLRRVPVVRWLVPASAVDAALLLAPHCFIPTLLASVGGWYLISIVLALAVSVAGRQPDVQACSRIFLEGVLYGARHLSPAGIGYTSHYMWHNLVSQLGMPELVALEASTLTRITITGLTIIVGFPAFLFVFNRHRRLLSAADRFDALSARYDEEMAGYVMDVLLVRKTDLMKEWLVRTFGDVSALVGVDIGCGTGGYAARMASSCGRIVALDAAEGQVRQAAHRRATNSAFLTARLPDLPLADGSVDFAYAINVLHHLGSRDLQRLAFREIARILKPGGVLFLHEINTINPLFRFYMGYVFPVLHALDDGSELWLTPQDVEGLTDMRVVAGEYFTFLPEFSPRLWQAALGFLERWLERSRLRRYSAHYMLICRKPAS